MGQRPAVGSVPSLQHVTLASRLLALRIAKKKISKKIKSKAIPHVVFSLPQLKVTSTIFGSR